MNLHVHNERVGNINIFELNFVIAEGSKKKTSARLNPTSQSDQTANTVATRHLKVEDDTGLLHQGSAITAKTTYEYNAQLEKS